MEFKGTKGKWVTENSVDLSSKERKTYYSIVIEEENKFKALNLICTLSPIEALNDEDRYNAQLIINAPQMLEMLKRSIEEINHLKWEYKDKGHSVKYLNDCEELIKLSTEI